MNNIRKTSITFILIIGISILGSAQTLEQTFDRMLSDQYPADAPGVTALVAIKGEIVYQKGFGLANMELNIPMEADMILEIGSITKQFTAVSILMLMEEGKLNLEDDITKFIKDYPTQGHKITIHHLLTHTSGIKSYTSMQDWVPLWRKDLKPAELVDVFKDEPMDFAPGERYLYNNSAYVLLGHIIELISGQTYEEFVESKIFEPVGMKSSMYGSHSQIIKKRAPGYQKKQGQFVNAEYLSLTQPYSAGSLMSSVEDLYKWNRAIRSNKLVKQASIDLAFTNYELNNGEKINYGYGWGFNKINGSPTIQHSGGIFGYVTNAIYLPEEDVFVAAYSNCDCNGPGEVTTKMAALALGKPFPDKEDIIQVSTPDLEKLKGLYSYDDGSSRAVTIENGLLYSKNKVGPKMQLFPIKDGSYMVESGLSTFRFEQAGNEMAVVYKNMRGDEIKGKRTSEEVATRSEIQLDSKILERYEGVFEIAPSFALTVTLEDGKLMTQATGQGKVQVFPESETKFFLKVTDAQIEFVKADDGSYDSLILYQAGRQIPAKRKK